MPTLSTSSASPAWRHAGFSSTAPGRPLLRSLGLLAVLALALVAGGLATAYGFWTSSGHRLLKLEAALGIATIGLAVVPLAALARSEWPVSEYRKVGGHRDALTFVLAFTAALLSAGAALVHLAVIQQHFTAYWLYGVFFATLGPAQLGWAILVLWRPSPGVYWIGTLANALVVAFFVVTRTVGTLIGPDAGSPEKLGFGDTATTVFEAAVVLLGVLLLLSARRAHGTRSVHLAGVTSLITLVLVPQIALALQSAIASAPFFPHAG